MTLSSRHRIRNSSPDGLRPSTLPLGHGGSPQYWVLHVDGEETFLFLQTAETGNRTPNSGVKGGHYPRAPSHLSLVIKPYKFWRVQNGSNCLQVMRLTSTALWLCRAVCVFHISNALTLKSHLLYPQLDRKCLFVKPSVLERAILTALFIHETFYHKLSEEM